MENIHYLLKTILAAGKQRQSFISAGWIRFFLRLVPARHKRKWALWILSLSPHYFFRQGNPNYKKMGQSRFLEEEFKRNKESREQICEQILSPYLKKADTVLDYGCGPGFLAKCVSEKVRQVFAVDISTGVLECAKILNKTKNVSYFTLKDMREKVEDNSVSLVYSFAVVQHLTDAVFAETLEDLRRKMKAGGTLLLHVILNGGLSEAEWRNDKTLYGRVKWHYGLNCFSRTEKGVEALVENHGFRSVKIMNLKEICREHFDDICGQHLVVANKPSVPLEHPRL